PPSSLWTGTAATICHRSCGSVRKAHANNAPNRTASVAGNAKIVIRSGSSSNSAAGPHFQFRHAGTSVLLCCCFHPLPGRSSRRDPRPPAHVCFHKRLSEPVREPTDRRPPLVGEKIGREFDAAPLEHDNVGAAPRSIQALGLTTAHEQSRPY